MKAHKELFSDEFQKAVLLTLEYERGSYIFRKYRIADPDCISKFYDDEKCLDTALKLLMLKADSALAYASSAVTTLEEYARHHEDGLLKSQSALRSICKQALKIVIEESRVEYEEIDIFKEIG